MKLFTFSAALILGISISATAQLSKEYPELIRKAEAGAPSLSAAALRREVLGR